MRNLWDETISALESIGADWGDVKMVWIDDDGSWDGQPRRKITKENFEEIARRTEYYEGFGGAEINVGLRMRGFLKVGTPFIMVRHEYDGAEWWDPFILYTDLPLATVEQLDSSALEGIE